MLGEVTLHLVLGKKEQNWDQKKKRMLVSKFMKVHSRSRKSSP